MLVSYRLAAVPSDCAIRGLRIKIEIDNPQHTGWGGEFAVRARRGTLRVEVPSFFDSAPDTVVASTFTESDVQSQTVTVPVRSG